MRSFGHSDLRPFHRIIPPAMCFLRLLSHRFARACALFLAAALFASTQTAVVAQESSGSISGRVRNAVTGRYLTNAKVSIAGTGTYVFTDDFGTYHLNHVRSGAVTLEVFYTGLAVQRQKVD